MVPYDVQLVIRRVMLSGFITPQAIATALRQTPRMAVSGLCLCLYSIQVYKLCRELCQFRSACSDILRWRQHLRITINSIVHNNSTALTMPSLSTIQPTVDETRLSGKDDWMSSVFEQAWRLKDQLKDFIRSMVFFRSPNASSNKEERISEIRESILRLEYELCEPRQIISDILGKVGLGFLSKCMLWLTSDSARIWWC